MSEHIDTFLDGAEDRLLADPYFLDVPVEKEKGLLQPGIISYEERLAAALTNFGAVVGLTMPSGDIQLKDISIPFLELDYQAEIFYEPFFPNSGSRKSLNDICEHVLAVFWHWLPMDLGAASIPMEPAFVIGNRDGRMTAKIKLRTAIGTTYDVAKVENVFVATANGLAILQCPTPNAAIWYTKNGSFPGPAVGLYATPIPIATGDIIKARAYFPSYRTSDLIKFTVR